MESDLADSPPPPVHNQAAYSVSDVSQALKRMVEDAFGFVRVRGEISGWKLAASGHAYLTLKDEHAVLDAVCWRGNVTRIPFRPEDGMEVIATGKMTTYPGRSKYQLVIDRMEPAGAGALMALLEQRKKALAAEGLFAPERKKQLPFMPQVIGVVTSPTGAVIRDILHRIADRFPVHVIVWPVLVQGQGAAEQIAAAIEGFNAFSTESAGGNVKAPDLIIVARGGGSLEDLWAFNEEIVVRAAAASRIPLISAVGHETDTTLIDFAADCRAPTPTAAAEMAVPVREEWLIACAGHHQRLIGSALRLLQHQQERVRGLARGLPNPSQLLDYAAQRCDDWSERLRAALPACLDAKAQGLALVCAALRPQALQKELRQWEDAVSERAERLARAFMQMLDAQEQRVRHHAALLAHLDYRSVLARGFAMVKNAQGAVVSSVQGVQKGEALEIVLKDGTLPVTAA